MWHPFLLCLFFHPLIIYSLQYQNSSSHLCNQYDKISLLQFKNGFTINPSSTEMYDDVLPQGSSYPKTKSWKQNTDCCLWDGVTCDSVSGHVIELDLSSSQLGGIIHSNNSLFNLLHLRSLNLAYNNFYPSRISPYFGNFSNLKLLNLSHTGFTGNVPIEITRLSQLNLLDLTIPTLIGKEVKITSILYLPYSFSGLEFPHFEFFLSNVTNLKHLHLNGVLINTTLPQNVTNLSSLISLQLYNCSLQGTFPSKIMNLPRLRSLVIEYNPNLYVNSSLLNNLSKSLEVIDFAHTNLSGKLPDYSLGNPPSLRKFSVNNCNLFGTIPLWVWNTSELITLYHNNFSGELPLTMNTKAKNLQSLTSLRLSNNLLKGKIPSWLWNLSSLIELELGGNKFNEIFTGVDNFNLEYPSSKLQYLDLSNNQLRGNILNFVTKFESLRNIDISHNNLTGRVPSSLASLTSLVFLDLSSNKLQGEFPPQLTKLLKTLRFLNVSQNQLVGRIPPQFNRFLSDSFDGNPGLCGPPLARPCGKLNASHHKPATTQMTSQNENGFTDFVTRISLWKIFAIGIGIGSILGFLAGGCMLFTVRPAWFSRKVDRLEYIMMQNLKKYFRRH